MNWKRVILFALAVPVVMQLARYAGNSMADLQNQREAPPPEVSPTEQVQAIVSSQDAEGITEADMSLDFLKNLETYTVERVKVRTKEALASRGQQDMSFDVRSEATYIESDRVKLAVIRLRFSDSANAIISNQVVVAGIVGKELKRVACVRSSAGQIPVSYGACGDKVKEVFGVTLTR